MPATTRTPMSRPPGATTYYLGRPAAWWHAAVRRPHQHRTSLDTSPGGNGHRPAACCPGRR